MTLPMPFARLALLLLFLFVPAILTPAAMADDANPLPPKLKVCQDPNNMPFSNAAGEGIENRIATLFGGKLGIPVEYFSFPQRLAFVRNTLRYKLPGEDYRCDVMLGVPDGFGQVATTNAYYRSTYALVYPEGGALDGVKSGDDFLKRAGSALQAGRLGLHDKSPAAAWLAKHQLTELARSYPIMSPDPAEYPGRLIDESLARGEIDAVIIWGPIAGYFAPRVTSKKLVVVPLVSEPGVRFDFGIAMGVRHGEPQWRGRIQRLMDESQAEITAILREFGVPLVNEMGEPIAVSDTDALLAEKQAQQAAAGAAAERTRVAALGSGNAATTPAAAPEAPRATDAAGVGAGSTAPLYSVTGGDTVDASTYEGFKAWRAAACDRCHGANQEGLVGPSLLTSLKTISYDEFVATVRDGRLAKGMQSFGNSKVVMDNIDNLYAYLKGRADGAITQAKVRRMAP